MWLLTSHPNIHPNFELWIIFSESEKLVQQLHTMATYFLKNRLDESDKNVFDGLWKFIGVFLSNKKCSKSYLIFAAKREKKKCHYQDYLPVQKSIMVSQIALKNAITVR